MATPDQMKMLRKVQQMQTDMANAQAALENETVEGSAGGGMVTVTVTGSGAVQRVHIDPSVVDPNEVDLLEDLIVAALHDAMTRVGLLAEQQMGEGFGGGLAELFGGGPVGGDAELESGVEETGHEGHGEQG